MNQHKPKRQVMGLHPAVFTGVIMMILVALLVIVLVFTGSISEQGPKVFWTVVLFALFTALLALDLSLSRSSARPLLLGTIANCYMLLALMLTIWLAGSLDRYEDYVGFTSTFELIFIVPTTIIVVRAAWGLAWLVLTLGDRMRKAVGHVFGIVTASLVGVTGIMLTLHYPLGSVGIEVSDWYWRTFVAVTILAAVSSCVLILLYWTQRTSEPKPHPQAPHPSMQQPPHWQQPPVQPPHGQPPHPQQSVQNPMMRHYPPQG